MQEVFKWCLENYRLIVEIVILVISVIVLIARKKPVKAIMEDLFIDCIAAVDYVEHVPGLKGKDKLKAAVEFVNDELIKQYPKLDITRYKKQIVSFIELILSTPQKKGE